MIGSRKSLNKKKEKKKKHMVLRVFIASSVWLYLFQLVYARFRSALFRAASRLLGLHVLYAWFVQRTVNNLIYAEWKRELPARIDMTTVDNCESNEEKNTIIFERDIFLCVFIFHKNIVSFLLFWFSLVVDTFCSYTNNSLTQRKLNKKRLRYAPKQRKWLSNMLNILFVNLRE